MWGHLESSPDISNEAVKEGMLEPWDDSPWCDSKPEDYHEIDRGKDLQPTTAEEKGDRTTLQVLCNTYLVTNPRAWPQIV